MSCSSPAPAAASAAPPPCSCARRGARLAICDRNEAGLKETAEAARELGAEVLAQTVDVTDTDSMDDFADAVHAQFDAVDLLINNAGIGVGAGFFDTTPEDWDRRSRSTSWAWCTAASASSRA